MRFIGFHCIPVSRKKLRFSSNFEFLTRKATASRDRAMLMPLGWMERQWKEGRILLASKVGSLLMYMASERDIISTAKGEGLAEGWEKGNRLWRQKEGKKEGKRDGKKVLIKEKK